MLEKTYDPKNFEEKIYAAWEAKGAFKPNMNKNKAAYSIVIPPPNVTGVLHMGHALNDTLQDILIRYNRMQGKNVLWQPGMDHAGIATQMVVERNLAAQGITRHDLGREKFIETVWQWKEKSGGSICNQLRRLGASCDWSRARFTMDEGLSRAVRKVFVSLYKDGLIYKAKKLVNWDSKFMTAVSDLEVIQKETVGKMYYYKYPIKGEEGEFVHIATTRPETMFGDTAVAISKDNEKLKHLIGKECIIPIINKAIPIIADEHADPTKGTGAVKITPAHDFNDFEVGKRHNLPLVNILNPDATLNENTPFEGMDTQTARKKTIETLDSLGLMDKIEDHPMVIPYGDRSNVVIEPLMTDQWFVDAPKLAVEAMRVVESGDMEFVPKSYEKIYFEWMRNIQPWCISRQLWWGHRIPAYYCDDCGEMTISKIGVTVCPKCGGTHIRQDEDVLDTWFSSALWPFSTLGFPEETEDLKYFYPTDVLVTGYDIIFFWVARMIFSGLEHMKRIPFKDVLIHGLVRDSQGRKMSKSLGNGIDPTEVIAKYGADTLRFSLAFGIAPGSDMRFSDEKIEGARNFMNKVWNASRFVLLNAEGKTIKNVKDCKLSVADKWIVTKLNKTVRDVTLNMEKYEMGIALSNLYDFVWNDFCDWYIEFTKPVLYGDDENKITDTVSVLIFVLDTIIKLLHPFAPFITEQINKNMPNRSGSIMVAEYPRYDIKHNYSVAVAEVETLKEIIKSVRNVKAKTGAAPSKKVNLFITAEKAQRIKACALYIKKLAGVSEIFFISDKSELKEKVVSQVISGAELYIPLGELVDLKKEEERLNKELENVENEIARASGKLANKGFLEKAPKNLVDAEREKYDKFIDMRNKLVKQIKDLKG